MGHFAKRPIASLVASRNLPGHCPCLRILHHRSSIVLGSHLLLPLGWARLDHQSGGYNSFRFDLTKETDGAACIGAA